MTQKRDRKRANPQEHMPDAEHVAAELAKAESMDDFFGKDGILAICLSSPKNPNLGFWYNSTKLRTEKLRNLSSKS